MRRITRDHERTGEVFVAKTKERTNDEIEDYASHTCSPGCRKRHRRVSQVCVCLRYEIVGLGAVDKHEIVVVASSTCPSPAWLIALACFLASFLVF